MSESKPLSAEVERRRTFAIISHPDAGKTTLTEKFLLYGGAIQMAGHVRAKKERRSTRSDWMEIEQQRGISVSSTALVFEYKGSMMNLLDTPGHQDFSEDTYRTLMAADSAIMVLDGAKGVEPQTRKLFQICRQRNIPIVTFINKMDRPSRDPFDLMDEVEKLLGLEAVPLMWPIGSGDEFRGVYDVRRKLLHAYERTEGGKSQAAVETSGVDDPQLRELLGDEQYEQMVEETELLEAVSEFDVQQFLDAKMTPVFFGSAINNFGVDMLLDAYQEIAPSPRPTPLSDGSLLQPDDPQFSAFVFKLQANMNKAHRDRVAFVRITSGKFERGMNTTLARTGKTVKLSSPVAFFGQDRSTIDEAFPGDIIGLINPGTYRIGDIMASGSPPDFVPLPQFAPEMFARIALKDTKKSKQFRKGVTELAEEGVVQIFDALDPAPIMGAVGQLQFEVFVQRIETEYGAPVRLEPLNFKLSRWVKEEDLKAFGPFDKIVRDRDDKAVVLFESQFRLDSFEQKNPDIELKETPY